MGKIIQITSAGNDGGMMLYALCDDGNVWEFCIQTGWVKLPLPTPSPNSEYIQDLGVSEFADGLDD
jgi:hypothetical protein